MGFEHRKNDAHVVPDSFLRILLGLKDTMIGVEGFKCCEVANEPNPSRKVRQKMIQNSIILRACFRAGAPMKLEEIRNSFLDECFAKRGYVLEFLDSKPSGLRFDRQRSRLFLLFGFVLAGIRSRPSAATLGIRIPKMESSVLGLPAAYYPFITPPTVAVFEAGIDAGHLRTSSP